jgi:hypothetical protein
VDIKVTFEYGKWRIDPEEAFVTIGTPVYWIVRSELSRPRLVWMIYFDEKWPFHYPLAFPTRPFHRLFVTTRNTNLGTTLRTSIPPPVPQVDPDDLMNHSGTVGPNIPEEEGDYKYGV